MRPDLVLLAGLAYLALLLTAALVLEAAADRIAQRERLDATTYRKETR